MGWLFLATAGQLVNAVVAILDKYIVSDERVLPRPFVYAFYSCLLTGFWVCIYFLGFVPGLAEMGAPSLKNIHSPTIQVVAMSFLAAYTFFMALVSMFDALKSANASTVMPVVGAVSALASFTLNHLLLSVRLEPNFIIGILLLAIGTLLVAQTLPRRTVFFLTIHSGIFFALHYITMKGLFIETNFDDGFFWSRIGFVGFALSLLLIPTYWEKIGAQTRSTSKRAGAVVVFTKVLAGVAAFLLLKATDMGDVAVVQATDGLKFVFILFIGVLFSKWIPESVGEDEVRPQEVVRKMLYVAVIVIGFFVLFA